MYLLALLLLQFAMQIMPYSTLHDRPISIMEFEQEKKEKRKKMNGIYVYMLIDQMGMLY